MALDTPQAVTVIDREEIEEQQAATFGELFDGVPGVAAIGTERVVGQTFNIRGFGEVPAGDEGRIVVLQDGATKYYEQYRLRSFFADPSTFCNIEVLRGLASATLYGAGAIGGVVRFETCGASDLLQDGSDRHASFSLDYATNGQGVTASGKYAARVSDNLSTFVNLTYRDVDEYEDGAGNEVPGSSFDSTSVIFGGELSLGSNRILEATIDLWNSDLDDTDYEQTTTSATFGTVDRQTQDTTASLRLDSAEAFGDLEVTLAYSKSDVEQTDASAASNPFFGTSILFQPTDYDYTTYSLDARVTNDAASYGELIYGATVSRQDRGARTKSGDLIGFHPEGTATRIAAFVQAEIGIGEAFTLIPGLRAENQASEPGPDDPAETTDSREEVDHFTFSPKVAFTYDLTDNVGFFGSLAQTQRAPTIDEIYSYRTAFAPVAPSLDLDPETARAVELGFTFSAPGMLTSEDVFDARATLYYANVKDIIVTNSASSTTVPNLVNLDEAEIYGLELEAAYVRDAWYGNAAVSISDGDNVTDATDWEQLQQDPLSLTIGNRNQDTGVSWGWTMHAFAGRTDASNNDFAGYATHDFFASYAPDSGGLAGFEVRGGIYNAFDREYRNILGATNGAGRSVRLTLTREFN